jgi:4-hydroxythreonine-4-phosphate dehydrogenase
LKGNDKTLSSIVRATILSLRFRMTPPNKTSLLIITPGDPAGIGPEITWKTLQKREYRSIQILCVGAREPFDEMGAKVVEIAEKEIRSGVSFPSQPEPFVWLLEAPKKSPTKKKSEASLAGFQSGWSIEKATQLVLDGFARAIITGPISKERLQQGGFKYPGHTEMLADLCRKPRKSAPEVTMMLANDQLRVSLATTHVSLKGVPKTLTRANIHRATTQTVDHLRKWWKIERPRVAVAALNPHAGEAGLFGKEEIKTITPEIRALQKLYGDTAEISGPVPADTLFAKNFLADPVDRYDAVVCMYHDQGLIPVKLLDFRRTVNVTLGLPIVRTSVDHGVGFDIAKTGKADPSSLQAALDLAIQITQNT